jgi:hypothetical protein
MRAVFGIVSLLVVLAIVGVLAKKQLRSVSGLPALPAGYASAPAGATVKQQSQLIQEQYKESLEKALQQTRPMPDDKKSEE